MSVVCVHEQIANVNYEYPLFIGDLFDSKKERKIFMTKKRTLFVISLLLLLFAIPVFTHNKPENSTLTPTPTITPSPIEKEETKQAHQTTTLPTPDPTPTPLEIEKMISLSDTALSMEDTLYFEFSYYSSSVECQSKNPNIVQAVLFDCRYDYEVETNVAGIMLYGINNGTTEIIITNDTNEQTVCKTITVEKPTINTNERKYINYLLLHGDTNDLGDKILTKQLEESDEQIILEYTCMDKNLNFYYSANQEDKKIEWNLIPTEKDNTEYYVTMRIGEDFITSTIDLTTYEGEPLAFEKEWFRIPVETELQEQANIISQHAYHAICEFLYEKTGMKLTDIYLTEN